MSKSRRITCCITASLALAPMTVAAAQSSVTISPFVSYVPSAAVNPLAGMALTFGGTTGLALRAGAELSIENPQSTTGADGSFAGDYRPWSADADAMLFLGGLGGGATVFSRTLAPYVFAGIGMTGGDSAGLNIVRNNWSYGAGAAIPLGLHADLFGELRWRMPEYVLPTSQGAPGSKSEMRFGLSFHIGGSERTSPPRRSRPRRYSDERYHDDREIAAAPAPAPAPAPVIVQQPAPIIVQQAPVIVQQPAPVVVQQPVIVTSPRPRRGTTININLPGSRDRDRNRDRGRDRYQTSSPRVGVTPPRSGQTAEPRSVPTQPVQPVTSCTARRVGETRTTRNCRPPRP